MLYAFFLSSPNIVYVLFLRRDWFGEHYWSSIRKSVVYFPIQFAVFLGTGCPLVPHLYSRRWSVEKECRRRNLFSFFFICIIHFYCNEAILRIINYFIKNNMKGNNYSIIVYIWRCMSCRIERFNIGVFLYGKFGFCMRNVFECKCIGFFLYLVCFFNMLWDSLRSCTLFHISKLYLY